MLVRVDSLFPTWRPFSSWDRWGWDGPFPVCHPWVLVDPDTSGSLLPASFPREDDEAAFWRAMDDEPMDLRTMGVLADWWQDRGDVRWEAMMYLYDEGRLGLEGTGYWPRTDDYCRGVSHHIHRDWYEASVDHLSSAHGAIADVITNRYVMMLAYQKADEATRAEWLGNE